MNCSLFSYLYCLFSIIYYSLCYSLYFITRYQHDAPTNWRWKFFLYNDIVLHVSIQALSNPFSNYNFTLYSSSCNKNCLTLSIFISVLLFLFLLWRWLLLLLWLWLLLILLFYVLVLNTRNVAKFGFVTLDITRKNSSYWILNVEIYLYAMDNWDTIK